MEETLRGFFGIVVNSVMFRPILPGTFLNLCGAELGIQIGWAWTGPIQYPDPFCKHGSKSGSGFNPVPTRNLIHGPVPGNTYTEESDTRLHP